jgi:lipopolysaccharide transport system ATP-binding protein
LAAIDIDHVSIDFPIYHGSSRSLKKTMLAAASGRIGQDRQQRVVVQALRDISFNLRPGDRLALVGGNGAGKTTLLRVLAGIYEPNRGHVHIEGKVSTLLDAGLGMNVDLSGRENIALRGLYNGMSKAEIDALADDVAAFAELGEFLELPVRFYSSGMVVRLAFAMATAIHPQVLLMDEWMLAGDANFLDKARARIEAFVSKAEILVLSTHVESIVLKWATRVIWLDQGRVIADGPAEEVMASYLGRPPTLAAEPDLLPII